MMVIVGMPPLPTLIKELGEDLPKIESLGRGVPKILLESGDNPENVDWFIYLNKFGILRKLHEQVPCQDVS